VCTRRAFCADAECNVADEAVDTDDEAEVEEAEDRDDEGEVFEDDAVKGNNDDDRELEPVGVVAERLSISLSTEAQHM